MGRYHHVLNLKGEVLLVATNNRDIQMYSTEVKCPELLRVTCGENIFCFGGLFLLHLILNGSVFAKALYNSFLLVYFSYKLLPATSNWF
jgi:hypothetical protein